MVTDRSYISSYISVSVFFLVFPLNHSQRLRTRSRTSHALRLYMYWSLSTFFSVELKEYKKKEEDRKPM